MSNDSGPSFKKVVVDKSTMMSIFDASVEQAKCNEMIQSICANENSNENTLSTTTTSCSSRESQIDDEKENHPQHTDHILHEGETSVSTPINYILVSKSMSSGSLRAETNAGDYSLNDDSCCSSSLSFVIESSVHESSVHVRGNLSFVSYYCHEYEEDLDHENISETSKSKSSLYSSCHTTTHTDQVLDHHTKEEQVVCQPPDKSHDVRLVQHTMRNKVYINNNNANTSNNLILSNKDKKQAIVSQQQTDDDNKTSHHEVVQSRKIKDLENTQISMSSFLSKDDKEVLTTMKTRQGVVRNHSKNNCYERLYNHGMQSILRKKLRHDILKEKQLQKIQKFELSLRQRRNNVRISCNSPQERSSHLYELSKYKQLEGQKRRKEIETKLMNKRKENKLTTRCQ
mmetsp:Transcript_30352/g.35338  ORF Transcript_30352/g.35338 Transcript_30352/m.35338 type:complete len:400 (-) Transcript_30352:481-1680(-)